MNTKCGSGKQQRIGGGEPSRILVVDDKEMVRDLLGHFLTRKGYQVTLAEDGRKALELFNRESFDLVLSDVRMPGLDGLQLLKALKDLDPRVPVVLISGHSDIRTVVEALKAGADNFITKPLQMDELGHVVNRSLELRCLPARTTRDWQDIYQETYFKLPSVSDLICEVVYQISLSAVAVGFAQRDLDNNLRLALTEGITNAMEHGNCWDPNKSVEVRSHITPHLLEVSIQDEGNGFDFSHLPDPTDEANLLQERGRGIFLMRAIMDEVVYAEPGNLLLLRKENRREPSGGEQT